MHHKLNQKGFSAVEGLLSLIAVLLIVLVSYYVYHAQRVTSNTYSAASKVSQSTPQKHTSSASSMTNQYLDIKELGVKFKLSEPIKDAYYAKDPQGYYRFSLKSFGTNTCVASSDGKGDGVVSLLVAKLGQPSMDDAGDPWTADALHKAGLKQIGDTYYGFQRGNGPCYDVSATNADTIGNKVNDVIQAFVAATPTFTKD